MPQNIIAHLNSGPSLSQIQQNMAQDFQLMHTLYLPDHDYINVQQIYDEFPWSLYTSGKIQQSITNKDTLNDFVHREYETQKMHQFMLDLINCGSPYAIICREAIMPALNAAFKEYLSDSLDYICLNNPNLDSIVQDYFKHKQYKNIVSTLKAHNKDRYVGTHLHILPKLSTLFKFYKNMCAKNWRTYPKLKNVLHRDFGRLYYKPEYVLGGDSLNAGNVSVQMYVLNKLNNPLSNKIKGKDDIVIDDIICINDFHAENVVQIYPFVNTINVDTSDFPIYFDNQLDRTTTPLPPVLKTKLLVHIYSQYNRDNMYFLYCPQTPIGPIYLKIEF